jgi:uncharacterized metal-binding protein YceD (DUF177 family)
MKNLPKIDFSTINTQVKDFSYLYKEISFTLHLKSKSQFVHLTGNMKGQLYLDCYRCGQSLDKDINIDLDFLINNGIYNGDDDNIMYETSDNIIDIQEISESEISLILNDYNVCKDCNNLESDFHIDI